MKNLNEETICRKRKIMFMYETDEKEAIFFQLVVKNYQFFIVYMYTKLIKKKMKNFK